MRRQRNLANHDALLRLRPIRKPQQPNIVETETDPVYSLVRLKNSHPHEQHCEKDVLQMKQ